MQGQQLAALGALIVFTACTGQIGPTGATGPEGPEGRAGTFSGIFDGPVTFSGTVTTSRPVLSPGSAAESALATCDQLYEVGVRTSGLYFINPTGSAARQVYCHMVTSTTEGGGWTLVYNSTLGVNVTQFWNIPYAERLDQRGIPGLATNYYDGDIYKYGRRYMDVIEDLRGKAVIALVTTTTGISTASMVFASPVKVSGEDGIFSNHFGGGWSSTDFDGDTHSGNCSSVYYGVTQHYGNCWAYNLGADADAAAEDGYVGPHLAHTLAGALGLFSDGSSYTRVRRISRFAKW
jgi:hypothetical protein